MLSLPCLQMHHTEDTRAFFMVTDCRFVTVDDEAHKEQLSEGEVQIFDMKGTTMRHISRLTISTLRAYIKFLQLAFPVRLKAIHMVNCPTYLDRIVSVVKPFISDEVFKLVGSVKIPGFCHRCINEFISIQDQISHIQH